MTCSVCSFPFSHAKWCPNKAVALTAAAPFVPAWVRRNVRKNVPLVASKALAR